MKKHIILSVILVVTLNAQDLKTTISEVLSTSPIILERLNNYASTQEDINVAQAGYYPSLDLKLGAGMEKTERRLQAGANPNQSYDFKVYQNSLSYTHNFFNGFSTTYQVKEQEYKTLSSAYSYVEKVNNTSFNMVNTYLEVMKNQELLRTAQENVRIDEQIFTKVSKLYKAGLTTLSEVSKIESSLALAESNLIVQENTVLDVSYNLQRVLGRELTPSKMSKPILDVALPKTQEEARDFALKNNPSLLVSEFNIRLAQATSQEKKSPFYPSLDVEVSQAMNKNLSGVQGEDDRFRAMAYVSFNLFRGFADSAALQKSKTQIRQENEIKNSLKRQITERLNLSWAANKKLSQQLVHLVKYKDFSKKTLTLYSKEYDLGRRSLLDLLSAQNDFIKAQAQIISTEYGLLYAKYRILDAMGILVPTIMNDDNNAVYSNVGLKATSVNELESTKEK